MNLNVRIEVSAETLSDEIRKNLIVFCGAGNVVLLDEMMYNVDSALADIIKKHSVGAEPSDNIVPALMGINGDQDES